jgi:hypothetical protein
MTERDPRSPPKKRSQGIPPPLLTSLFLSLGLAGCPHAQLSEPTPSAAASGERSTGGTFLEPEPARPTPVSSAEAHGVVALREPVGSRAVLEFVEAFLDAWRRESLDDLDALLSQSVDAGPIEARGRGRAALIENWKQRLKAYTHEYARLEGELVDPGRIEHWDSDEGGHIGGSSFPRVDLRVGDVYVTAPLRVTSSGSDRLFGDFLVMVLRREKGDLRMVAYGETDERPSR